MLNCRSCFFSCFFWLPGPQLLFRNSSRKAVRSPWYKKPQARKAVQCTLLFFSVTGFQTVFFLLSHANKNPPLIKFWISNPQPTHVRCVANSSDPDQNLDKPIKAQAFLNQNLESWTVPDRGQTPDKGKTGSFFKPARVDPLLRTRTDLWQRADTCQQTDQFFFKHVFQLAVGRVERQPLHAHPCFKNHSQHPSSWHHWWWLTESLKTVTD